MSTIKYKKTFTLIEMLIVIVIIGILAAALVPRLQSVQGRARDTKRKTDLRAIANGLEVYFTDYGNYPPAGGAYNTSSRLYSTGTQPWISGLQNTLTSIPTDPINNLAHPYVTGQYTYMYYGVYNPSNTGAGTPKVWTYDLVAQLENTQDPDRCEVKLYKFENDATLWCGSYSRQIYDFSPNVANQ